MARDIYQEKTTYFIIAVDTKVALYNKSEDIFFGNHDEAFKKLQLVLHQAPVQKWMMVSGQYLRREMPAQFKEYIKLCDECCG